MPTRQTGFTSTGDIAVLREEVTRFKEKVEEAKISAREYEYLLYRITSLTRQMGLPPQIDDAIRKIQQMVLVVRVLHAAMIAMETGTTFGVIKGLLLLAGAWMTTATMMDMERPTY